MTSTEDRDSPRDNGPFGQGYSAWHADVPVEDNPFKDATEADDWRNGWLAAKAADSRNAPRAFADANLIDAAPDLLDAIMKSDDAHWTPAMRAAVAKATGAK
jgi:hypothetical protein